jgi:hypothetical protein
MSGTQNSSTWAGALAPGWSAVAGKMGAHPLERALEPMELDRLHQVVDRGNVEGRHGEIVERGDEHHGRVDRRFGQGPRNVDPIHAGHGNVEQHDVGRHRLGDAQGRLAVIGGADDRRAGTTGEQQLQTLDGERLVVDHHHSQFNRISHCALPA